SGTRAGTSRARLRRASRLSSAGVGLDSGEMPSAHPLPGACAWCLVPRLALVPGVTAPQYGAPDGKVNPPRRNRLSRLAVQIRPIGFDLSSPAGACHRTDSSVPGPDSELAIGASGTPRASYDRAGGTKVG